MLLALPWSNQHLAVIGWLAPVALLVACWRSRDWLSHQLRCFVPALVIGLFYATVHVQWALAARVPLCADEHYRELEVVIDSQPDISRAATGQVVARFAVRLVQPLEAEDCEVAAGTRLRLNWYEPPQLRAGERWRLTTRVRPAWSYQNPGGSDYERWLFGRDFQGSGYVRDGAAVNPQKVLQSDAGFESWLAGSQAQHRALILALVAGDGSQLSDRQWRWFRDSGTIHLMVVSGLHVGVVTGAVYFVMSLLLRLVAWSKPFNVDLIAGLLALLGAAAFVVSTGSGIPAQRAWLMAAVLVCASAIGWRLSRAAGYSFAMTVVLVVDPLAVHAAGFYLSFAAVAVLLAVFSSRPDATGAVRQLLSVQLVLYLFMTPLLAMQQPTVPLFGGLINFLAVPMLAVILPLLLTIASIWWLLPELASTLLVPADWLLDWLMRGVEFAAGGGRVLSGGARPSHLLVSLLAAVFLCCRMPWRWRVMSVIAWMAWVTPVATDVPPGEFRVTALDVGQGSALLIDTAGHRLLFDTGPEYPGGFNLGAAVVLPSLLRTGPPRLDAVVLSHQDLDHTGGMSALREDLPINAVYSSFTLPQQQQTGSQHGCQNSISWVWDNVTFRFLTPAPGSRSSDNDRSCVLHVAAGSQAVLLSGDISSRIERRLVRESGIELNTTVMTAPHHGSNGSSSRRWIEAAGPHLVLISAPRRSRYGHPHAAVTERYRSAGARLAVTGRAGALVWKSWQPEQLFGWRLGNPAYWINQY